MKDRLKELVYRGIKYTTDSLSFIKKRNARKELCYRGIKYIDEGHKKTSFSGSKRCYRGICY